MKKVFSLYKYIERQKQFGFSEKELVANLTWAVKCVGLTEEKMNAKGYVASEYWLIEVEE